MSLKSTQWLCLTVLPAFEALAFTLVFQGRSSSFNIICDNSKMYYQRSRKKNKIDLGDLKSRRAQSADCNKNETSTMEEKPLSYDEIEQVLQGIRSRSSSRPPPPKATPPPLPKVDIGFSKIG